MSSAEGGAFEGSGRIDIRGAIPGGGVLGAWLEFAAPLQAADSFWVFALLAAASAAVNRRVLINPGGEPECFTNIYVLLMGPSGARKGAPIRHARRLLRDAVPEAPVLPTSFTMEAVTKHLAMVSEDGGAGRGLSVTEEFKRLVGGSDYMKSNLDFLTEIWDCEDPYSRLTVRHELQIIRQPYLVGLWAAAPELFATTDEEIWTGGALRRILGVAEHGPKHFHPNPKKDKVLFAAIAKIFRERLGPEAFKGTEMKLSPEALEVKAQWFEGYVMQTWRGAGDKEGHFASCMEAHAMKLGALVGLLETGRADLLGPEALRAGQRLVEAIVPNLFGTYRELARTPYARLRACIVRTLRQAGGRMPEGAFNKKVKEASGCKPDELLLAKNDLAADGVVGMQGGEVWVR